MISAAVAETCGAAIDVPEVVGRVAERALVLARERELQDRAAVRAVRHAAGCVGQRRVLAAAGRDEVEPRAGVGVLGEAAVLGDGADRSRPGSAAG